MQRQFRIQPRRRNAFDFKSSRLQPGIESEKNRMRLAPKRRMPTDMQNSFRFCIIRGPLWRFSGGTQVGIRSARNFADGPERLLRPVRESGLIWPMLQRGKEAVV